MEVLIFAVKDIKLSQFNRPFPDSSSISAMRSFHVIACDENSQIGKFPEDYQLFEIAKMNLVTGKIESYDNAKFLTDAMQCQNNHQKIMEQRAKKAEVKNDVK